MPAFFIARRTPSATFSTIAGRPISSGNIFGLSAVPMTSRGLPAGPVLALRANTVACGVITPSQPPDHTIGTCLISASDARAVLLQHRAERLIGKNAGEVVDPAIALGLADDGDHLVGLEAAGCDVFLEPRGIHHALDLNFYNVDCHRLSHFLFKAAIDHRPLALQSGTQFRARRRRLFGTNRRFAVRPRSDHDSIMVPRRLQAKPYPAIRREAQAPARARADRPILRRRWSRPAPLRLSAPARHRPDRRACARSGRPDRPSPRTACRHGRH